MLKGNSDTLQPGHPAPEFALPTVERNTVRLSDYSGKPIVLVFIRGTW